MKIFNMNDYPYLPINTAKQFAKLKQKKHRYEAKAFIAEGLKVCEELLKSKYNCTDIIINDSLFDNGEARQILDSASERDIRIFRANDNIINKIADAITPQGILAIAEMPELCLNHLADSIIALENIQDPGNLGTILRTAHWFGIKDILISNESVDIYNPKVVRSTMGSLFHLIIKYSNDLIDYCKKHYPNHEIFASSLEATQNLSDIKIPRNFAVFFGNEAKGLSEETLAKIENKYIIKGMGEAESLNLSIATGISLYQFTKSKIK